MRVFCLSCSLIFVLELLLFCKDLLDVDMITDIVFTLLVLLDNFVRPLVKLLLSYFYLCLVSGTIFFKVNDFGFQVE